MWGYSFEDIARRAQEEASKLAEQASTTLQEQASTFNLDSMNTDVVPDSNAAAPSSNDNGFFTPGASSSSASAAAAAAARPFHTEPHNGSAQTNVYDTGGTDHFNSLVSNNSQSSPDRKPAVSSPPKATVTKLEVTADDFFDSWGDDEVDAAKAGPSQQDESDAAAERMREESRKMAEQIMLEEQKKREEEEEARRIEEERLAAEKAEADRLEQERLAEEEAARQAELQRLEEERLAAEKAEAERLEQERLAAEEAARLAELHRIEEERLAAEKAEAERLEQETLAAEEAARQAELRKIEEERLAAEKAEADRLEQERLAAEEAARLAELQRKEEERLAAEKAEADRLEQERLAAEEAARQAELQRLEEERLAAEKAEAERLEQERLAEEEAARQAELQRIEEERLAAEKAEADRLEQERLAEEEAARQAELQRIEEERLAVAKAEAERLEQERLAAEEERLAAAKAEAERLEQERLAAEEAARLAEEEERLAAKKAEAERLEQERLAAEEAARLAELQRIEEERLAAEKAEAERLEQVAAEEAARLAEEEERLAAAKAEAERLEQEKIGDPVDTTQSGESDNKKSQSDAAAEGWGDDDMGDIYDDDELDDMYDDDDDSDEQINEDVADEVTDKAEPDPSEQAADNIHSSPDEKQNGSPAEEKTAEEGLLGAGDLFDAAAAVTSMSTSLQSTWDTSGLFGTSNAASTTSMFSSWGYSDSNKETSAAVAAPPEPEPEPKMESVPEKSSNAGGDSKTSSNAEATGQDQDESNGSSAVDEAAVHVSAEDSPANPKHDNVSQHTLDNFMKQLERMTESHQLEMDELMRTHKIETDRLEAELLNEREKKKNAKARDEVASQDKFLKQMRELEKGFRGTIDEKERELSEVMASNEGMGLKLSTLQREVDGLTKLVDERDEEIIKLKTSSSNSMMQVEGQVKTSQEESARKDREILELRNSVESLQADFDTTSDAYNTLKARAKAVATELKDRRVEVRTLSSQNEELTSSNASLDTQLNNLRALVNQHELTIGYKDKDMEEMNQKVKDLNKQIAQAGHKSLQDRSVGEKAIASYKRKAQEALAAANARLAAANQAREEAESDAKNARQASDDAVAAARVAETKRSEAEKKANETAHQLESERQASSEEIDNLKDSVDDLKETVSSLQSEVEDATKTRAKLVAELEELNFNLTEQKEKNSELREQLIESTTLCESLQREVNDLNDEVQRSSAAAFKRAKEDPENGADRSSSVNLRSMDSNTGGEREESDGTIIMLQQELQGANEAIAELKLALRTALLEKADFDHARNNATVGPGGVEAFAMQGNHVRDDSESKAGNESTPLFFAIEKQNELKTARDEINRLANMLGDAESAKQEAYDEMEEMRRRMEDANSRLLRYEKLGMKSSSRPVSHSSYGPFRNAPGSSVLHDDASRMVNSGNDSAVNLEYLKNVMLSFLTAKTLADRRKLVPVVATVLCLTPEEQAQAISSVEQTAGLTGVASSFWENIESKAHNLM